MKLPFKQSRPAHSLLYITEAKTFRIDTDRRGVMQGDVTVTELRCDSANSLPAALTELFAESAPLGKTVWILYARLNTYLLNLPSVQVEGVETEVLEQALLFEYESLSGQPVSHSHLAYQFISEADDMSSYWINLIAKETFTKITEVLKKSRCRLGGITHPGGLPALLSAEECTSWLRIESWPNTFFALNRNPETGLSMMILHPESNTRWQDELDHWILDTGDVDKSETLINNKIDYLPLADKAMYLNVDGAMTLWLTMWAGVLTGKDELALPLLNTQRKINMDLVYMLGGGGLALLLCTSHFTWNLYQRNEFQYQVERLGQAEKDIADAQGGLSKSQGMVGSLTNKNKLLEKNSEKIPLAMKALQQRPMAMLKALASHTPADLIIESVTLNEEQVIEIKGVSLQPHLVNQLVSQLRDDFLALGWRMNTPEKIDLEAFSEGGPWEFSLLLFDDGLEGFVSKEEQ